MTQPIHPMLERVARALCKANGADPDADAAGLPRDNPYHSPEWRYYIPDARAAVHALMEPDERQIDAIGEAASQHVYGYGGSTDIYLAGLRPLVEGEGE